MAKTAQVDTKGAKKVRAKHTHFASLNELVLAFLIDLENTTNLEAISDINEFVHSLVGSDTNSPALVDFIISKFNHVKETYEQGSLQDNMESVVVGLKGKLSAFDFNQENIMKIITSIPIPEMGTILEYITRIYDDLRLVLRTHYDTRVPSVGDMEGLLRRVSRMIMDYASMKQFIGSCGGPLRSIQDILALDFAGVAKQIYEIPLIKSENMLDFAIQYIESELGIDKTSVGDADSANKLKVWKEALGGTEQILFETESALLGATALPYGIVKPVKKQNKGAYVLFTNNLLMLYILLLLKKYVGDDRVNSLRIALDEALQDMGQEGCVSSIVNSLGENLGMLQLER